MKLKRFSESIDSGGLKFKQSVLDQNDGEPFGMSDEFFYEIGDGGYLSPEKFLEEDDAIRVREAISLIQQYEQEGCDKGFFDNFLSLLVFPQGFQP